MNIPYKVLCIISIATMIHTDPQPSTSTVFLNAGKLADGISRGNFVSVVTDVVSTINPFLDVFTSVIQFISGKSSTAESPELRYLRQMSENLTIRFDQVDAQFSDLKIMMKWSTAEASYSVLESKIHAVSDDFRRIFQVPSSGITEQMNIFIKSYENDYLSSGSKLFAGFMFDSGTISQGLIQPAMTFIVNDRGKMRTFMLGILKLLLMAAKVELGYLGIKGYDHIAPFYSHQWRVRIERVQEKMKAIYEQLKNIYYKQFLKDIDRFALDNHLLSNQNFSELLYGKLSKKYFWRDWLVVASTHTKWRHDAHSRVCTGVIKSVHSKDIVVDSVDHDKPFFNISEVNQLHSSLVQTCNNKGVHIDCYSRCFSVTLYLCSSCTMCKRFKHRRYRCGSYVNHQNADDIFSWLSSVKGSCSAYSSIGIIATNKQAAYYASPSGGSNSSQRLFVSDLGICHYNVHFFG